MFPTRLSDVSGYVIMIAAIDLNMVASHPAFIAIAIVCFIGWMFKVERNTAATAAGMKGLSIWMYEMDETVRRHGSDLSRLKNKPADKPSEVSHGVGRTSNSGVQSG